ncbi:hypothetical protein FRC07_010685 [Ceratobasidium sp. 392]|nr:hypothetical protein FRC07_010685 [Ceratobasidium sp. 392]
MDDRAEEIAEAEASRTGKPAGGRKTKPCARHYHGDDRMLIPHAVKRQFALAVTECAYGNYGWMVYLSEEAWEHVHKILLPGKALTYPNGNYFPMIANRGATNRGDVMKHVRPIGYTMGNFIDPPMTDEDEQHNIREVKRLLPKYFHYGEQDPPRRPYEHPGLVCAMAAGLFYSPTAVGPSNLDLFGAKDKKIPLPAAAFVLTNLSHSLSDYGNGRRRNANLKSTQQFDTYVDHLRGLETYGQQAPNLMAKLQTGWYEFCVAYAGITDEDEEEQRAVHDIFNDIPPDISAPSSPEPADAPLPPSDNLAPATEPAKPSGPLLEPYFPPPPPPGMLSWAGLLLDADGWEQYDNELLYGDQEPDGALEPEDEPELEPEPEPEPEPKREYDNNGRLTAHSKGKGRSTRPSYVRQPDLSRSRR